MIVWLQTFKFCTLNLNSELQNFHLVRYPEQQIFAFLCNSPDDHLGSWARFPFKVDLGHPQTLTLAVGCQPEKPGLYWFGFLWAPPAVQGNRGLARGP